MTRIFNLCIVQEDEWDALNREKERYKEELYNLFEKIEKLHEYIRKITNGERCEGTYCESCRYAIPGDALEYVTSDERVITIGKKTICELSVPCPDFERKEE